ncbi:DNA repair protein RecO [Solitalea sp. MAHUQ-68]|uniref:DNA repair protein RecO n=1 Tax=Solitalea agri TaxID=2953739 RepID=A0A9X2JFJ7_9SPHI|nr:DNA repair protein RecO [Solitalea agri]MCO4293501.1 DNA repair protein RecO [Solitalea agri]
MSALQKTRGIVLRTTNYAESSMVVFVFTEQFGLQSFIVNGVRKPKAKFPASLFQPLNLVEMVIYYKNTGGLQRISELRNSPPYTSSPFHLIKSSILQFLNEVIYKCLKQETEEPQLFSFVYNSLQYLDVYQGSPTNFHLIFLVHLARFLGFYPVVNDELTNEYFDLKDAVFTNVRPMHSQVVVQPYSGYISQLMQLNFEHMEQLRISSAERKVLLHALINYYELHVDNFGKLKSFEVLEEVLGA